VTHSRSLKQLKLKTIDASWEMLKVAILILWCWHKKKYAKQNSEDNSICTSPKGC